MCLAVVFIGTVERAAFAKMPYYSIEISPQHPVAGEIATVTVRWWSDSEHTVPTEFIALAGWDDFLHVYKKGEWAPGKKGIPIRFRLNSNGIEEGQVVVPQAGEWEIVVLPLSRTDRRQDIRGFDKWFPVSVLPGTGLAATPAISAGGSEKPEEAAPPRRSGNPQVVLLGVVVVAIASMLLGGAYVGRGALLRGNPGTSI